MDTPQSSVPSAVTAPSTPANPLAAIQAAATTLAELVQAVQSAVPEPAPATVPDVAAASQEVAIAPTVIPVAGSLPLAGAESRLRSSRLWTMIGTVATLALQNPVGLNLSPVAQLGIAGVAAIYIASRSITGGNHTGV